MHIQDANRLQDNFNELMKDINDLVENFILDNETVDREHVRFNPRLKKIVRRPVGDVTYLFRQQLKEHFSESLGAAEQAILSEEMSSDYYAQAERFDDARKGGEL